MTSISAWLSHMLHWQTVNHLAIGTDW